MALVLKDRVKETSTTTGTGTFTLAGASTGFQSFSVIGNGNTVYYCIVRSGSSEWEVGIGTYTSSGTTLSRDTILESSNSGSAVNFSAGTKEVFCTYPAEKSVTTDISGTVAPTVTIYTSGSGTYTVPSNCKYLVVELVGGGGGGGGSGASAGHGGDGGNTTFGVLTGNFGYGGLAAGYSGGGGSPGSASLGGLTGIATAGQYGLLGGASYNQTTQYFGSNHGFPTPLGIYGRGGTGAGSGAAPIVMGSGAGSAGYVKAWITSLASSYSYAVGAGGTAGSAGTNGYAGGAGGSGCIIVMAFF